MINRDDTEHIFSSSTLTRFPSLIGDELHQIRMRRFDSSENETILKCQIIKSERAEQSHYVDRVMFAFERTYSGHCDIFCPIRKLNGAALWLLDSISSKLSDEISSPLTRQTRFFPSSFVSSLQMAKVNLPARLRQLRENDLSSPAKSKSAILSGYQSLVDILLTPQVDRHLYGQHDLLFQCISQILLTKAHKHFTDDQLKVLLETASNSRVLTMSQNQVIDAWCQNIEERVFDEPEDFDDDDDDDDDKDEDWSDDTSESEEQKKIKPPQRRGPDAPRDVSNQKPAGQRGQSLVCVPSAFYKFEWRRSSG